MSYCTFAQAKSFVAAGYGECDPAKLGEAVNKIRLHFFNWYKDIALFLDAVECFRLHRFCVDCDACHDSYLGITLPRDFQTVEALWWNDWPIRLQSSWREFQVGISPECDCRLQKFDVPGTFPTAVDILPGQPKRLRVRAFDEADNGKRFVVRGRADTGQPFVQEFDLSTDSQETSIALASIARAGGIIKAATAGRVVLSDEEGTMLGMFEPEETVPAYKRIKITGVPEGCGAVNVRAARRYFPLSGDDDVVETDNQVAFDSMARYLRLYERSDKTRESMATEKDHYATAFNMMMGAHARDVGRGTQAAVTIMSPAFGGGTRLHGRGMRRW